MLQIDKLFKIFNIISARNKKKCTALRETLEYILPTDQMIF